MDKKKAKELFAWGMWEYHNDFKEDAKEAFDKASKLVPEDILLKEYFDDVRKKLNKLWGDK